MNAFVPPATETHAFVDGYELLRGCELGTTRPGCSVRGLAVVIHKGLAAWMATCLRSVPSLPESSARFQAAPRTLPHGLEGDVIPLLASMVFSASLEVSG